METEKRKYPRFKPQGLHANIRIDPPFAEENLVLKGEIIDMSYNGIKIRLSKPLQLDVDHSIIKIEMTMPESGIPISIHGLIKHIRERCECGLQFTEVHPDHCVDDLMFECIKLAEQPVKF